MVLDPTGSQLLDITATDWKYLIQLKEINTVGPLGLSLPSKTSLLPRRKCPTRDPLQPCLCLFLGLR
ncbi:hypothetical protein BT96DRAFT_922018, partial [Gymnopus androsaceus JB14]